MSQISFDSRDRPIVDAKSFCDSVEYSRFGGSILRCAGAVSLDETSILQIVLAKNRTCGSRSLCERYIVPRSRR